MGLLKAAFASASSTLRDQYLDIVTCEDTGHDVLVKRGTIKHTGNNKGNSEVLSNGSKIIVPKGFAMMLIDQGAITELTLEEGEFVYESGTESSIFHGKFSESLKSSIKQFGERIKFGAEIPKDTRVYYVNMREITGNKFGTPQPVPFDDPKYQTIDIRYFGMYSLKVSDPVALVTNLIGTNAKDEVSVSEFLPQLKSEFIASLTTAMVKLAYKENISYNRLPVFQEELELFMNEHMDDSWTSNRGLEVVSVSLESISVDEEMKEKIRKYDEMYFAENHAQGMTIASAANAMVNASQNENGSAGMFMGMGVGNMMQGAMQAGTQMAYSSQNAATNPTIQEPVQSNHLPSWTCVCGKSNKGKFCMECGTAKPTVPIKKFCTECGNEVTGKFCANCGAKTE